MFIYNILFPSHDREEELKEIKQKRIDKQDIVYEHIWEYDKLWRKEKHKYKTLENLIRDL